MIPRQLRVQKLVRMSVLLRGQGRVQERVRDESICLTSQSCSTRKRERQRERQTDRQRQKGREKERDRDRDRDKDRGTGQDRLSVVADTRCSRGLQARNSSDKGGGASPRLGRSGPRTTVIPRTLGHGRARAAPRARVRGP